MSEKTSFDLVVLGGGPGGYTAAFRAADLGLDVCIIEKENRLGGVCLNVGCIPSKTLLHVATVIEEVREAADFGIQYGEPSVDLEVLRTKKEGIISQLTQGLDGLCKARAITRMKGTGIFRDNNTIVVRADSGDKTVSFKDAVIATGSRPFVLPNCPDDPRIWDSSDALALRLIPKRLLIIGGGIIGLEMAQVYSAFGSDITIVEMLDQIIPPADKDMVQPLFQKLKKRYKILTKTKVTKIEAEQDSVKVTVEGVKLAETMAYDAVLGH